MTRIVPFLALAMASEAFAAGPYTICVQVNVQTNDSGKSANGITEDFWVGANSPSPYRVRARGVRVRLTQPSEPDWSLDLDTDPTTGCGTFTTPEQAPVNVRVYAHAKDEAGNIVRVHTQGTDTSDWYPNPSLSVVWKDQNFVPGKSHLYVVDGRGDERWTTFAVAAFGLYRFHAGIQDRSLHIGMSPSCGDSGSTHDEATLWIEEYGAHHIRIGTCKGTNTDARQKGTITHEMGHALMRLHYGSNGQEDVDKTFEPPAGVPVALSPDKKGCWNVGSYGMQSLEYNSLAWKEANADFIAARVWNLPDPRGSYMYRQKVYDLESWDAWWGTFSAGGYRENWCDYTAQHDPDDFAHDGVTTKGDFLRLLWDMHTAQNDPVTRVEVMEAYKIVRQNDDWAVYPLTSQNHSDAAMFAFEMTLTDEQVDTAWYLAEYNGVLGP